MIKAIAFDPGKTTGFATGEIEGTHLKTSGPVMSSQPLLVQTAQAVMEHADIFKFLQSFHPDYIICERFDFRNKARTGLELISREFIGVVELYTQLEPDCTLVMQSPGAVLNGYWSPKKLKELHLYRKGCIHANEATMHLLYWYRFGSGAQYGKEIKAKSDVQETSQHLESVDSNES